MPITILLVDDHPVFRKGLRLLLEAEKDLKVVGEAGNGQEGIDRARELSPDVVIMDITMPNFNGIDATRQIVSESPGTKIIALSIHSGKRFIKDMLQAGAAGYILKECAPEELINGLRSVVRGETFLNPSVQGIVISEFVTGQPDLNAFETIPIIRTKLHRPPISKGHVHRQRLLEQLEKGRHNQLTLVSAPTGYGKSVLLSCWLENCDCPHAWFSVDESDNNLRQFLIYFLTAIRILFPDAMEDTLTLANTANLPPLKVLAASLLNEMNLIDQDYILALDDIHLIHEKQVLNLLTELLRYPPQRMHLVLIGRRDPFIPISSLRARGRMTEIRLQDLCFIPSETKAYLEQMLGEQVEDAVAAKWTEKTEGWIVGLHLAALSIRERDDAADMLADVPGGLQYVTEYLFNEVFEDQPPEIRQYLLITAILDRFCAPLCDALCVADEMPGKDEIDGQEFINWLLKDNLFVIPLDTENRWFRYHHLFQQLLQDQLKRYYSPEDIIELHSRAGEWLEGKGLIEKALHHALAAGEIGRAAQIIERHRQDVVNADQWYLLDKWLSLIPETFVQQNAELLMARAWVLLHHFRFEIVLPLVDHVEALIADDPARESLRGEIALCRGYSLFFMGEGADSLRHIAE